MLGICWVLPWLLLLPAVSPAQQNKPWEKIPIPPLHEFKPQQPKRIALKNGIVLFLQEDHELPFVSGSVLIPGGSRDEDPAKIGLIELYGQTWRTSGTEKMSGDAMDDLLESKAAHIETGGDDDSTALSWDSLKADTDQVYGLAMDLLFHPKFDAQKLRLAQQQTATGIVRRNDDESRIAGREAAKLVYGADSPYARQPELSTIGKVTVADLQAWHDRTIGGKLIVSISGDFDSAAMEAKLRATFEGLPAGEAQPGAARGIPRADARRLLHQQGRREPIARGDCGARNRTAQSGCSQRCDDERRLCGRVCEQAVPESPHTTGACVRGRRRAGVRLGSSGNVSGRGADAKRDYR